MKLLLIIFITSLSLTTFAKSPNQNGQGLTLGAGVAISENIRHNNRYDRSDSPTVYTPIPLVNFRWGPLTIGGRGIQYSLYRSPLFAPFLIVNRAGDTYYGDGLNRRKPSWFAGAGARFMMFRFSYKKDILSRNHGSVGNFSINYRLPITNFGFHIRTSLGLEILDKKFTNYYYGVTADQSTTEFPEYKAKTAINKIISLNIRKSFTDKMSFMFGPGVKFLDNTIADSPTVDKDSSFFVIMGVMFNI
jgi:outer membrane protein